MAEDVIKEEVAQDSADEAETQVYEIGFHIVPTVEESKLSAEVDSIKSLIEKDGGTFITEEFPKNITLAYTIVKNIEGKIKKFDNAYFGWVKFEMKTDSIVNVKEGLDLNKEVLRYLIIKTVKESTLIPKGVISPKPEISRNVKPKAPLKTTPEVETKDKENKEPVSEKELDKTIEELIVE
ncbi:30S ribosomal protein S6 [bacterium]|nr:30S ribosomal protein S6 [bacterium]MBT4894449.1 30S ribosomal protein S6 [bacterium]